MYCVNSLVFTRDQFATHLGDFLSDIIQNAGDIGGILFSDTSTQVLENLKYQKKIWQVYQVMQENVSDILTLCAPSSMINMCTARTSVYCSNIVEINYFQLGFTSNFGLLESDQNG